MKQHKRPRYEWNMNDDMEDCYTAWAFVAVLVILMLLIPY